MHKNKGMTRLSRVPLFWPNKNVVIAKAHCVLLNVLEGISVYYCSVFVLCQLCGDTVLCSFHLHCGRLGLRFLRSRDVRTINCLETSDWKQPFTRISMWCQTVQKSPPIRAEKVQRVSGWSWMGKWERDIHSVPEIDKFKEGIIESWDRKKLKEPDVSKCVHSFFSTY